MKKEDFIKVKDELEIIKTQLLSVFDLIIENSSKNQEIFHRQDELVKELKKLENIINQYISTCEEQEVK